MSRLKESDWILRRLERWGRRLRPFWLRTWHGKLYKPAFVWP